MKGLKTISKGFLITKGFKLIAKGFSYGKGLLVDLGLIPNYSDIIRYFTSREGNKLIDKINDNDADLLLPTTIFNGIDGVVKTNLIPTENSVLQFKYKHTETRTSSVFLTGSSTVGANRFFLFVTNGLLRFGYGDSTGNTSKIFSINEVVLITAKTVNNTMSVYVDDVFVGNATKTISEPFAEVFIGAYNIGGSALSYASAEIWDYELDGVKIPILFDGHGINEAEPTGFKNVDLTVVGGVSIGFDSKGTLSGLNNGQTELNGEIYPNDNNGNPTIQTYDYEVKKTNFINASRWKLRLYTAGDTALEKTFFNRSIASVWKTNTEVEDGLFDSSEVMQSWIYLATEDTSKYQWWSKDYKELFLYSAPLSDPEGVFRAKTYVGVGEGYTTVDYSNLQLVHPLDYVTYE